MKKDIYIAILEFGEHQGLLGATARDLYAHLHTEGYISDAELEHFNKGTYNEDEGIKINIVRLFICLDRYFLTL